MIKRAFGLGCAGLTGILVIAAVAFTVVREDLDRAIDRLFGSVIEENFENQIARFDPDLEVEDIDLVGRRLLLRRRSTGERLEAVLESSEGERLIVRSGERRWEVELGGGVLADEDRTEDVQLPQWLPLTESVEVSPLDRIELGDGRTRLVFRLSSPLGFEDLLIELRGSLTAAGFHVAVEVDRQEEDSRRQGVVVGTAADGRAVRVMIDRNTDEDGATTSRGLLTIDD